jgi:ketosteroid isomerase-like protein
MSQSTRYLFPHAVFILLFFTLTTIGCVAQQVGDDDARSPQTPGQSAMLVTMEQHLDAVSHKDLTALAATLSPAGKMQLILPNQEIVYTTEKFLEFHEEWFKDTTWTFETEILSSEVGTRLGAATCEIMYREPDRNGKPYSNRMIVTYLLEQVKGQWYVISDHASSIEKSTD